MRWTAETLLETSGSYWQACTLHAAVKLGVFDLIGDGGATSPEVAKRLHCDRRAAKTFLHALTAMNLLVRRSDRFFNSETSGRFLLSESPQYIGHMILHHHHLVDAWARLDSAVLSGGPVRRSPPPGEAERESFLMGMYNLAAAIAPRLANEVGLAGRRRLLDLGGGPGTYAIYFCLAHPGLTATVFDQATTRPVAERTIRRFGLSDRITFVPGDYLKDPIEGGFDAAWLSHILHGEGPEGCRIILRKAASSLEGGGILMVHEFILDDTMDRPLFPALFSLNMLVNTKAGRSYSESDIRGMLEGAGLGDVRRLPFRGPNDSGVMTAVKP